MAFGLVPLDKRLKENIKNYSLDQIFDIGELSEYLEAISAVSNLSFLLVDRHGEKAVSIGNFVGFKPDVVNAPGAKIRVYNRTIGHLYTKESEVAGDRKKLQLVTNIVRQLTRQAEHVLPARRSRSATGKMKRRIFRFNIEETGYANREQRV